MSEVLVVGGGHNGLTCAAYLARAGVEVTVLEARATAGGCASTVDALGARVNVCSCDHGMVRATGIIDELELSAHGLEYVDLHPRQVCIPWDRSAAWLAYTDPEATLDALARTHPSQVAGYRRYLADLLPAARLLLDLTRCAPTPAAVAARLVAARGRGVGALLALSRRSAASVLRGYFDEAALLGPVATTGPAVWGLPPGAPRSGLGALGYALGHLTVTGRPRGGSGALTDALAAALQAAGGTLRTGVRVRRILCAADRVHGVELDTGERIEAATVIAAADPRTALVEWLDAPSPRAAALVRRWRAREGRDGYESKLDALVREPPVPRALDPALTGGAAPGATMVVAPGLDGIASAHADAARGTVAERPLMLVNVPSLPDPAMRAPDGDHVLSLEVLFTPYRIRGGWAAAGAREPERWLTAFAGHVQPGWLDGVRSWRLVGPEDYERDFSMPAGYAPSFSGGPLAALAGRDRELTRYATPVGGLYLTGSGTFPGAGVSGAPGRNAANVVLAALRPTR